MIDTVNYAESVVVRGISRLHFIFILLIRIFRLHGTRTIVGFPVVGIQIAGSQKIGAPDRIGRIMFSKHDTVKITQIQLRIGA